jgi:peptidoglycan/xylan/chitin deacetylase (PgdA/CDA1 family)
MLMGKEFISTYEELLKWRPHTLRDTARGLALKGLILRDAVTGASEKYINKPRIQFLYLHHVFRDEEQKLEQLLNRLSDHFEFISYSDAVDKILSGTIDKPYISFSSDDGVKNNLIAAEILNGYNAKACFFVNPALIGETEYEKIRSHCVDTLDFPVVEFLNWDDLSNLLKQGHEIGGHTMSHMNIAKASYDEIVADAKQTLDVLKAHCGRIKHFAFPYGRFFHFSEAGRKAVFEAGYISCASAERGCHVNHDRPLKPEELCIRRDHIVLDWGIDQIFYFIINNAKNASVQNNLFPPLQ